MSLSRTTNGRSRGVADDRDRRRVDHDPLEAVQVLPSASARIALITSPWDTATQIASSPCSGQRRVVLPDRVDGPRLHGPHRLAARERHRARVLLDDLPQRVLGQGGRASGRSSRRTRTRSAARSRCRTSTLRRRAAIAAAVCWQRSSGLVTIAASGSSASRCATAAACSAAARRAGPPASSRPGCRRRSRWCGRAGRGPRWACPARYPVRSSDGAMPGGVIMDCAVYRRRANGRTCPGTSETRRPGHRRQRRRLRLDRPERSDRRGDSPGPRPFELHPLAVEDAIDGPPAAQARALRRGDLRRPASTLWYVDEDDDVETGEISGLRRRPLRRDRPARRGRRAGRASARAEEHADACSATARSRCCTRSATRRRQLRAGRPRDRRATSTRSRASVFSDDRTSDAQRIYTLKREVLEFRRAVAPAARAARPASRTAGARDRPDRPRPFFRDVADHLLRSRRPDRVHRPAARPTPATPTWPRISVQQNDDMRKISAWVAIAAVPTVIAGIYGMNFEHMPELRLAATATPLIARG